MANRNLALPEVADRKALDADDVLWRYMDIEKYLDLLTSEELHLPSLSMMADPWEGSVGPSSFSSDAAFIAQGQALMGDMDRAIESFHRFKAAQEDDVNKAYVNCWHLSGHESAAMWSLYAAHQKGVAIRTTVGRLCDAIQDDTNLFIGRVAYRPQSERTDPFKPLEKFTSKLESYRHEQEVRLVRYEFMDPLRPATAAEHAELTGPDINQEIVDTENVQDPSLRPKNYRLATDLTTLIDGIVVAPFYPEWGLRMLQKVTSKFIPKIDIQRSTLEAPPSFI